jgi:hypothetical protein
MEVLSALGNYFLSVWLWSITWGGYHVPFAVLYMFLLLKMFVRISAVQSVVIAIGANLFAWLSYTAITLGALCLIMSFEYIPNTPHANVCERTALICGSLALIYAILQILLLSFFNISKTLNITRIIVLCGLVNALAALSVYTLLPLYC